MKLRVIDRVVLFAASLFLVLIGLLLFISGFQFSSIPLRLENEGFFTAKRLFVLTIGLFCIAYGAYLLLMPKQFKEDKQGFITQKTATGELRISLKAIETMAEKCVSDFAEIKCLDLKAINHRGNVLIKLNASMPDNVCIPMAIEALQKQIRKTIASSAGIEVKEVVVSIDATDSSTASSKYTLATEAIPLPLELENEPKESSELPADQTPEIADHGKEEKNEHS